MGNEVKNLEIMFLTNKWIRIKFNQWKTQNTKMLINVLDRENHEISFSFPVQKKKKNPKRTKLRVTHTN